MMGKKKAAKKTKELSVAIAEASTVGGGDETQHQQQPLTPRKRGRPRKIIDQKSKISEEKQAEEAQEIESKKSKTWEQQEEEIKEEEEASSVSKKEEGQSDHDQEREVSLSKEEPFSRRSRARRKGNPRKSS